MTLLYFVAYLTNNRVAFESVRNSLTFPRHIAIFVWQFILSFQVKNKDYPQTIKNTYINVKCLGHNAINVKDSSHTGNKVFRKRCPWECMLSAERLSMTGKEGQAFLKKIMVMPNSSIIPKIPDIFQKFPDLVKSLYFPDFSLTCGNPKQFDTFSRGVTKVFWDFPDRGAQRFIRCLHQGIHRRPLLRQVLDPPLVSFAFLTQLVKNL